MRKKTEKQQEMTPEQLRRLEVARELGLEEKILTLGWGELTSEESGRIGGILSGRTRAEKAKEKRNAVCGAGPQLRFMDAAGSAPGGLD